MGQRRSARGEAPAPSDCVPPTAVLSREVFPISRPSDPVWLGLEGISGAGKTTQAAALHELLTRSWGSGVSVTSEFGDDSLGSFVAGSTGNGRLRLKIGREEPNHARHLLAVSSRVNKIKLAALGGWDAMLFDVFTLSDMAHALADLSTKADNEVRTWLRIGMGPLLEDTAAIVHGVGFTLYIDCRPEVAAHRLAARLSRPLTRRETDFLRRLSDAYEEVLRERPQVVRVNGEAPVDQVTAEIASHLERALAR